MAFPYIRVKRGAQFVEDGNLASAGGLSSGIDLSLRVVERYFGRDVAQKTAFWWLVISYSICDAQEGNLNSASHYRRS